MRVIVAFAAGCLISSFATFSVTTQTSNEEPAPRPITSMKGQNSNQSTPTSGSAPYPDAVVSQTDNKPQDQNDTQATEKPPSPNNNGETENFVSTIRTNLKQVQEFRNLRTLGGEKAILQTVADNYKNEKVHHEWAAKTRNTISDIFQSEQKLAAYTPSNVNCRSESCQITVSASNARNIEPIYDGFRSAISQKDDLKQSQVSYFRDRHNGNLVMYLTNGSLEQLTTIDN